MARGSLHPDRYLEEVAAPGATGGNGSPVVRATNDAGKYTTKPAACVRSIERPVCSRRIWVIHRTRFPTGSFHFVLNSDASQNGLRYRSAFASHNTSAVRWQHLRRFQSWGAAQNPECKQVSCGFSSVRGVGRSHTLKIRALRNMLIGSTARSMRRSGNGAIFASLRS